jgi:methyltransferase (TIGR00027 family)
MQPAEPSRTALAAAFHRAAHQILEGGRIFADPLALVIAGESAGNIARWATEHPSGHRMRMFIAVRTRFAEDALAAAFARGAEQLVVLGAGLDTYALRGPLRDRLRIFEVDHPATQSWKRQRLAEAAIPLPASLTFVPVDFERKTLADCLAVSGFEPGVQTFFTWLGVVPYLTKEAAWSTLGFIAGLRNGAHVVFDYGDPPESLTPDLSAFHDKRAARVAELGEPWINYFESDKLRAGLLDIGFREVEHLGPPDIAARYFPERAVLAPARGGHIVRASTA